MNEIDWHPVFIGIIAALVVSLVVAIVAELWNHHRGERGDFWSADELLFAEMDRWDPEILAVKPGTSEEKASDERE